MRELPACKRERFEALGLSRYDTLLLADDVATAEYFDAAIAAGAAPKPAANWILSDLSKHCNVSIPPASRRLLLLGPAPYVMRSVTGPFLCLKPPTSLSAQMIARECSLQPWIATKRTLAQRM
jgi:hypothetical protein